MLGDATDELAASCVHVSDISITLLRPQTTTWAIGWLRASAEQARRLRRYNENMSVNSTYYAVSSKKFRLTLMNDTHSLGTSSSGKIASTGQGSTQAPQSMHSSGSMKY